MLYYLVEQNWFLVTRAQTTFACVWAIACPAERSREMDTYMRSVAWTMRIGRP